MINVGVGANGWIFPSVGVNAQQERRSAAMALVLPAQIPAHARAAPHMMIIVAVCVNRIATRHAPLIVSIGRMALGAQAAARAANPAMVTAAAKVMFALIVAQFGMAIAISVFLNALNQMA